MRTETTVRLHFNLYDLPVKEVKKGYSTLVSWHDIEKEMRPSNVIKREFIPYTLGDFVDFYYEFNNEKEKDEYIKTIPDKYKKFIGTVNKEVLKHLGVNLD